MPFCNNASGNSDRGPQFQTEICIGWSPQSSPRCRNQIPPRHNRLW